MPATILKLANTVVECPAGMLEVINADAAITAVGQTITIDHGVNVTITFDVALSGPEDLALDNIMNSWDNSQCPIGTGSETTTGADDHTLLLNIGTNTHDQIDTHLADTSIHFVDAPSDGNEYVRKNGVWAIENDVGVGLLGMSHQLHFGENGDAKNEWLAVNGTENKSNETPGIIPFASKLVAMTYSNKNANSDTTLNVYSTPTGGGSTPKTLEFSWVLVNKRNAFKTDFTTILFDAGDKIAVYANDTGGNAKNVEVVMYFEGTSAVTGEGGENYSGNFATGSGGGSL